MTRVSTNQYKNGILFNGYDYANQAWVANGVYVDCGHPEFLQCTCYGRQHAGEKAEVKSPCCNDFVIEGGQCLGCGAPV